MKLFPFKKVSIVAERVLRDQLLDLIRDEGATGHTLLAAEGEGSRGVHATDFEGRHVQIEVIASPRTAGRILARIEAEFLENFAVIAYLSEVEVLRREKFTGDDPPAGASETLGDQ